jgi:hypothetical protein
MINRDETITIGTLLKMLADGRITADMPVTFYDNYSGTVHGIQAVEIHTYKDGSQAVNIFDGAQCAFIEDCVSTSEVFP